MQNAKATAWGAGIMGMAGLAGALLGLSPLLLPIAPLVAIAYRDAILRKTGARTLDEAHARIRDGHS